MIKDNKRHQWVDVGKGIGMFLVFYGHILLSVSEAGVSTAFNQFKFIYAFHMPLFFFMAGFFWKPSTQHGQRINTLISRRIIPVMFFGGLTLPLWPIHQKMLYGRIDWDAIIWKCLNYLHGDPSSNNSTTWFLVCLFTCEIIAMISLPKCRSRNHLFIFGVISLFVGLFICYRINAFIRIFGVSNYTWFIYESIVALGFYTLGYAFFPTLSDIFQKRKWILYIIIPSSLLLLLISYKLNNPNEHFAVIMAAASHGKTVPFLISAMSGIFFITGLAFVFSSLKVFLFIGKNTLILLGLSGIFYHFINIRFVARYLPEDNWLAVTTYCTLATVLSLITCVPFIVLANKYTPMLIGNPEVTKPRHETL